MATKPKAAAKKKPVAKKAPAKAPAKKTTAKKPAAKATAKVKKAVASAPRGPRETKAANAALKLVDEAAAALRKGIRDTAGVSEKNRLAAKKKAHDLLTKATSSLSSLLSNSSSVLKSAIDKI